MNTTGSLLKRTRELLDDRGDLTLMDVYEATGIPFHWLTKFAAGKIDNPSVNKTQRLYEFLAKRKLEV